MSALTSKQEAFAQAVASGKYQSDAYRTAYKVSERTKPESVNQSASRLMSNVNIASRVAELRKPVVEAAQITLASHLSRLEALSQAHRCIKFDECRLPWCIPKNTIKP